MKFIKYSECIIIGDIDKRDMNYEIDMRRDEGLSDNGGEGC